MIQQAFISRGFPISHAGGSDPSSPQESSLEKPSQLVLKVLYFYNL